jgi:hypothetical protein
LELKAILGTASKAILTEMLDANLLEVIAMNIRTKLARVPMREIESIQLFECLQCLKAIMNNAVGMNSVISKKEVFSSICQCLRFISRPLALEVLEILSVSCNFNDKAAERVIEGLRGLSTSMSEPNLYFLKVSIFFFLNSYLKHT